MKFWIYNVWNSFIRKMQSNALIIDDYRLHKALDIGAKLGSAITFQCLIPGGLNPFLKPLDVGINHIVKQELRERFSSMMVNLQDEPARDDGVSYNGSMTSGMGQLQGSRLER